MRRTLKHLLAGIFSVAAGSAAADSITFYQNGNFGGRQFTADRTVANFENSGFNDKAHSAVVHEGRWEICFDADFHGSCGVLTPGAYPDLGAYAGRVSSVRPVDARYSSSRSEDRGPRFEDRGPRFEDRGHNRDARATLYEGPGMTGRSFALNDVMRDLDRTRFNDRASSLRVESGYWIFCSDAEFRGECRTFGPGEYATLPGMDNAISSGRRISNAYPYGDRPNWQRDPLRQSQYPNRPQ